MTAEIGGGGGDSAVVTMPRSGEGAHAVILSLSLASLLPFNAAKSDDTGTEPFPEPFHAWPRLLLCTTDDKKVPPFLFLSVSLDCVPRFSGYVFVVNIPH